MGPVKKVERKRKARRDVTPDNQTNSSNSDQTPKIHAIEMRENNKRIEINKHKTCMNKPIHGFYTKNFS